MQPNSSSVEYFIFLIHILISSKIELRKAKDINWQVSQILDYTFAHEILHKNKVYSATKIIAKVRTIEYKFG